MRKYFIITSLLVSFSLGPSSALSQYNTNYGTYAGQSLSTGARNSLFGYWAGATTTTGSDNSFFGFAAGKENTTGELNTFVGASAGAYNTSGIANSFFGASAGAYNTTGSRNSFYGNLAGARNTSGCCNSLFGENAGHSNTTGDLNSFVGHLAGYFNTAGEQNSFYGTMAGVHNTSGSWNVFIGSNAGNTNTTGSYNTLLGHYSDVSRGDYEFAAAIGAGAQALSSNSITLGRRYGEDLVRVPGMMALLTLASGGTTPLCRSYFSFVATCSSSARYKTNIHDFTPGLDLVQRLRPVVFNWREGGMLDFGLVAEDVHKVEPLLTTLNEKGEVEGVKYDRLGVVLINAINEQQRHIEKLEKQTEALKSLVCSRRSRAKICR